MSRRVRRLLAAALVLACLSSMWGVSTPARADDPVYVDWPSLLPTLVDRFDPSSENDCVAGRAKCLDAILKEMRREFEPLANSCSHNAPFALAYWRITESYGHARLQPGYFQNVPVFNHVVAVFAKYYLSAYQNWKRGSRAAVPQAWLIPFDAAAGKQVTGTGNLLMGVNAHVNRDLAFVMAATGLVAPDGSSKKADYDKVNQLINTMMEPLLAEEAARFDPSISSGSSPLGAGYTLNSELIATWREQAWRNAERLVSAPTPQEQALVAQQIETNAASQATTYRAALSYQPPVTTSASRETYCAANHDATAPIAYFYGTPEPT
jgi:Family of unknown function (DUF5995)